ncbi:MAG: glucuronosyltransferase [Spirochaetaceae bacterium]|nr:MAG: glucuronosyltransferase [Spirochaetaceae bacterium]
MIYVTVGTQLPFDRMVRAMDSWAARRGRYDVFAQIGRSSYEPSTIEWVRFLTPEDNARCLDRADLIVSHAGTGTIIDALQRCKPIIVFPRRMEFGEHRTDHQMATARRFEQRGLVCVVENETVLETLLEGSEKVMAVATAISDYASEELIRFLTSHLAAD